MRKYGDALVVFNAMDENHRCCHIMNTYHTYCIFNAMDSNQRCCARTQCGGAALTAMCVRTSVGPSTKRN